MSVVRFVMAAAVAVCGTLGVARAQSLPAVSTIAGSGAFGIPGGPLAESPFMEPLGAAVGADGTIYVSDFAAQRIVQIDLASGVVRTVAGSGAVDASGLHVEGGFLDGPALSARFNGPAGIAVVGSALLIADSKNHCIRRLKDGVVSTVAGLCGAPPGDVTGSAEAARFYLPMGLAATPDGTVYVADSGIGLRAISSTGSVTAVNVPTHSAYGAAYDVPSATLFVTTAEGLYFVRDGAVVPGIKFGSAGGAIASAPLSFGYALGRPFGIVALDGLDLLYTDIETGALRYLEGFTGSSRVLSGSGEGGDYRTTGRATGPLSADSFVAPIGLALAPDRGVIVADALGRTVRRIEPWRAEEIVAPASGAIPTWQPKRYRIAYIGNSTIWTGTTWFDSIENRLQTQLDTPAFRAAHGVPEVQPFWIVGTNGFAAAADYGEFLAENQLVDAIVIQQSSLSLFDAAPKGGGCSGLDNHDLWDAGEASILGLGAAAAKERIPVVGVAAPAAFDVSAGEQVSRAFLPTYTTACYAAFPEQSRRFHAMLLGLLGRAHIAPVDLWPDFIREERSSNPRPLFGSFDAHFTARGREITADAVFRVLSPMTDRSR
jgi:hypothetical protein